MCILFDFEDFCFRGCVYVCVCVCVCVCVGVCFSLMEGKMLDAPYVLCTHVSDCSERTD